MKTNRISFFFLPVLILGIALFFGCNKNETGGGSAQANEKVTLRVITHRTWADFIPLVSRAVCTANYSWGNSLIHYDYTDNYVPELGKSWEWSEDGNTLIFHLQDKAYFSNGSLMTAEDVAFTFQFYLDKPTAYNNIVTNFIKSVEVVDAVTVAFHFYNLSPRLWEAFYTVTILHKEGYLKDPGGYSRHPYGTGGWKLTYAEPTTYEYRLERWDDSWWWDWYNYTSNIDEIIITQNSEESSRISALRAGEVDAIESVSADSIPTLESEGFYVNQGAAVNWNFLGFNVHKGSVFQDVNVRMAASYAIDRKTIVNSILGGKNHVYTWPCRPEFMGYQDTNAYPYDPEKAKELLANSSYKGQALEMIVCVSYVVNASECAQAIQAYLEKVGFKVNLSVLEAGTYQPMQENGDYDINFSDLSGSVSQNLKFVWEAFGNDQFNTGWKADVSTNLFDICQVLDSTMDETVQAQKRNELYSIMAKEQGPYVLLWSDVTNNAATKAIKDVSWQPTIMSQYYYRASKTR